MSEEADIMPEDTKAKSSGRTLASSTLWSGTRGTDESTRLSSIASSVEEHSWESLAAFDSCAPVHRIATDPTTSRDQNATLREECDRLRAQLEDKDFQILQDQSEHVKALSKLRQQLENRDKTIKELKHDLSRAKAESTQLHNRSMANGLDAESKVESLKEQVAILKARLEDAREKNVMMSKAETGSLSRRIKELEAENSSMAQELHTCKELLHKKSSEVAERDAELMEIQAHLREQHAKIRALHEQLSSFVSRDAEDTAKVELLEQDLTTTRTELDHRVQQLQKVVKALNRLKEREAATSAALETQTNLVAQLQEQLTSVTSEGHRLKRTTTILQQQHSDMTDTIANLQDQLDRAKQESDAKAQVVEVATRSADSVRLLNAALENAKQEIGELRDQLAQCKVESRREILTLQRTADERQAMISSLQADLTAATTALGSAGGQSNWTSSLDASRADTLDMTAHSARSVARKRGFSSGITGGKPILPTRADAPPGDASEAARLRLQNESLSRRLMVADEKIRALESEQDALLEMNERLRAARPSDAKVGSAELSSSSTSIELQKVCVELVKAFSQSESIMTDADRLALESRRLLRACEAALDGKDSVPTVDVWDAETPVFARTPLESRFTGLSAATMLGLRTFLDTESIQLPPTVVDIQYARDAVSSLIATLADVRAEIQDRLTASLGQACATQ